MVDQEINKSLKDIFLINLGVYRRFQERALSGFLFLVPALSPLPAVPAMFVWLFFDDDELIPIPGPFHLLFLRLGKCLF